MANAFNKGDVVVLKSGGPPMVVDLAPGDRLTASSSPVDYYRCLWFKGATPERGNYSEHVLQTYVPPAPKAKSKP